MSFSGYDPGAGFLLRGSFQKAPSSSFPSRIYTSPGIGSYISTGENFYTRTPQNEIPQIPILPSVQQEREDIGKTEPGTSILENVADKSVKIVKPLEKKEPEKKKVKVKKSEEEKNARVVKRRKRFLNPEPISLEKLHSLTAKKRKLSGPRFKTY